MSFHNTDRNGQQQLIPVMSFVPGWVQACCHCGILQSFFIHMIGKVSSGAIAEEDSIILRSSHGLTVRLDSFCRPLSLSHESARGRLEALGPDTKHTSCGAKSACRMQMVSAVARTHLGMIFAERLCHQAFCTAVRAQRERHLSCHQRSSQSCARPARLQLGDVPHDPQRTAARSASSVRSQR